MTNNQTLISYLGLSQCCIHGYVNQAGLACGTISLSTGAVVWQENLDQKRAHTLIDHLQKHIEHLDALETKK